jgi:cell wall-associated NlpC family hydrolase
VKRKLRIVFVVAATVTMALGLANATEEKEETLGDKLKKLFVRPTPTPTPRRHHRKASHSPTPAAETSVSSVPPSPTAPAESTARKTHETQSQYFEPVRAISPGPRSRTKPSSRRPISVPAKTPTESINPEPELTPAETPESRPMPSMPTMMTASPPSANKTPASSGTLKTTAAPVAKKMEEFKPVIPSDQIAESSSYPAQVRKIVDFGLYLAAQHLTYKYASADPAKGGMDCSGFIHYVLTQSGIADAPRDAREQYAWIRKAGNFKAVLAQRDDTFELDELQPGDLLFWATNFGVSRDPQIIQTMIYIGRDKTTNARLMVGACERGTFKGQPKSGVSAFDFKVGRAQKSKGEEIGPVFVGYGHIPSLAPD